MSLSRKAKRWLKIIAAIVVGLPILLIIILLLFLGSWIKAGIACAGPELLGVESAVESVSVSVLGGSISLKGLAVGNPEGYTAPHFVKADLISVSANIWALMKKEIHVREIILDGPELTYEISGVKSNLSAIMDNLTGEETEAEKDSPEEDAGAYRWKIDRILIKNVRLKGVALGETFDVTIEEIELNNIQDADGRGLSTSDVLATVLSSIDTRVEVSGFKKDLRRNVEKLKNIDWKKKGKDILKDATAKPEETIKGGVDTLKGILGK